MNLLRLKYEIFSKKKKTVLYGTVFPFLKDSIFVF